MNDLAKRLDNRIQLTSDGLGAYSLAVDLASKGKVDYAQLIKHYSEGEVEGQKRYSPAKFTGCETKIIDGDPDPAHISYIERSNLTSVCRCADLLA